MQVGLNAKRMEKSMQESRRLRGVMAQGEEEDVDAAARRRGGIVASVTNKQNETQMFKFTASMGLKEVTRQEYEDAQRTVQARVDSGRRKRAAARRPSEDWTV